MAGGNRLGFNPYNLLPAERIGILIFFYFKRIF